VRELDRAAGLSPRAGGLRDAGQVVADADTKLVLRLVEAVEDADELVAGLDARSRARSRSGTGHRVGDVEVADLDAIEGGLGRLERLILVVEHLPHRPKASATSAIGRLNCCASSTNCSCALLVSTLLM
jgi:hypothetical protein